METVLSLAILGKLAGLLMFLSYLFYITSTLRGQTKPNRATWIMLAVISLVIALSYHDVGAENTLWVAVGASAGTLLVAILSIWFGSGGWEPFDRICIAIAIFTLSLYFFLDDYPLFVLFITLIMDGAAMAPTILHSMKQPLEEDKMAWTLTVLADFLAIIVIETWTFEIALYPIYMLLINGIVVYFLYRKHLHL